MSLEEAYKWCLYCNRCAIAYDFQGSRNEHELSPEEEHQQETIENAMDSAKKELECLVMTRRHEPSQKQLNRALLAQNAIEACENCNYKEPAIARLLEKELPERFGEKK